MVVVSGIMADGTKRILDLPQGATENAEVCTALLEDLESAASAPAGQHQTRRTLRGEPTEEDLVPRNLTVIS
jgi:hypothetical protein